MGDLSVINELVAKHECSVCSSCQAEFFYDGVSYFVASENGGPDAVVCRKCFDETLGR
jgi:ribosomal protein L40E